MKKRKTLRNRLLALTVCLLIAIQAFFSIATYAEEPETQSEPYEYTIPTEIISQENIEHYGHKERYSKAEEKYTEFVKESFDFSQGEISESTNAIGVKEYYYKKHNGKGSRIVYELKKDSPRRLCRRGFCTFLFYKT